MILSFLEFIYKIINKDRIIIHFNSELILKFSSKLFSGHSGHSPNSGHQYISPDSGPGQIMTGRDERFDCLKACDWSVGNQSHYWSKLSKNH